MNLRLGTQSTSSSLVSFGSIHREYLFSFAYLAERKRKIGFSLLNKAELDEMKLAHSINTFDASFEMADQESDSILGEREHKGT